MTQDAGKIFLADYIGQDLVKTLTTAVPQIIKINEEEAAQIRMMFHLAYTYGYGAQCIANHLNADGYKNRAGQNWHPSTIQSILRNTTYTGVLKSGKTVSPVQESLCIVDQKIFDNVQDMLENRSRKYQETRSAPLNTRGNSLMAGNIFCGHCGARLCVTTSGKGRRGPDGKDIVRTRYCCQTKTRTHGECDGQSGYTVHKVDEIIDAFVRSILEKVRAVDRSEIIQVQNNVDMAAKKQHIKELEKEAAKAESELRRLQSEIIKSLTGESAFTPEMLRPVIDAQEWKLAELMQNLRSAQEDMRDSENNLLTLAERFDDVLEWASMYDKADMPAKKMIVSRIIERVDMYRDYEIKITLNISIEQFLNTIEMVA